MAENVLVDLECRTARWFDFETMHDTTRQVSWRRADDVRGLLVTCLLRTPVERRGETLDLVLDAYGDPGVAGHLTASFSSVWRRPLTFHLAQAPLSFTCFQEIGRLLAARLFAHPRAATR